MLKKNIMLVMKMSFIGKLWIENKILMKACLGIVLILNIIGCFNARSSSGDKELLKDLSGNIKDDSSLTDRKKIQLVETVLNLPDVIKFSKLEITRKKHGDIYILLKDDEFKDDVPTIIQQGHQLSVLRSLNSIDASDKPCYVFTRMELKGDTAYVQMIFDTTGLLVFGKLNYIGDHWVPDRDFKVGVR